ncbi:MAG: patatin-like phospholipase family protein [Cyclobacteriaceae bacterium]|nr:patatin-like phospholipase family protein [Cyclobacteriaceae bacterium]
MNNPSVISLFLTIPLLFSCSKDINYTAVDSPIALTEVPALTPGPKVALVLGSGGPRGYAHIGILKVLEKHNIPVDLVIGSSVGALVGSFWAAGYNADEISRIAAEGGPFTLFDFSLFLKKGWIKGQRLQDYVNDQFNDVSIEQLPKSLIIVATRESDGKATFFQKGNLGVAVRASSAVMNVFAPVGINNTTYIDADESLPVAVEAARQAGAQFIIAVDVSAKAGAAPSGTSEKQLAKDARRRDRINPQVQMADFLLHPDLEYKAGPWRKYFVAAEKEGEKYALSIIEELLEEMKSKSTK